MDNIISSIDFGEHFTYQESKFLWCWIYWKIPSLSSGFSTARWVQIFHNGPWIGVGWYGKRLVTLHSDFAKGNWKWCLFFRKNSISTDSLLQSLGNQSIS
jgi:hypothetical protein